MQHGDRRPYARCSSRIHLTWIAIACHAYPHTDVHATAGVTAAAESYSGKDVSPPGKGHHFLHIDDFSTDELRAMLATAAKVAPLHSQYLAVLHECNH